MTSEQEEEFRWLTPDEQQSWRAYITGTTMLTEQLDRELQDAHGISLPEYEILVRLSESPGRSVRMAILAGALSYSRSRTTHTVKRLENLGLIRREAIPDDGRGVAAVMTARGWELLRTAAPTHVRGVRTHFVDRASAADFAILGRVFDQVSIGLLGQNPDCPMGNINRGSASDE